MYVLIFFFVKQKTAYEMRISDWSSDVCSSDLWRLAARASTEAVRKNFTSASGQTTVPMSRPSSTAPFHGLSGPAGGSLAKRRWKSSKIGRASCRERVGQYV